MNFVLSGRKESLNIGQTLDIEKNINTLRDNLKMENIQAVNDHLYDYAIGTMFIDIVTECEKLGDYVVNVVEARLA